MTPNTLRELLAALAIEGPAFAGVSIGGERFPAVVHDGDSVLCELPGYPLHHDRARAMAALLNAAPALLARLEAAEKVVEASRQLVSMYERATGLPCPPQLRRALAAYDQAKE